MAEHKKSQAERAVSEARKKKGTPQSAKKSGNAKKNKKPVVSTTQPREVPIRLISSIVLIGVFILLLVMAFFPGGILLEFLNDIVHGLVGNAGFAVAIPVSLYLFFIHGFSGNRPIKMRTYCLSAFVLICGCITHLAVGATVQGNGIAVISELYLGGVEGIAGGAICGGVAMLIRWLCGDIVSYILLILAGILTLLGGMQITVPSIIRAVKNRPRVDWEDEQKEERQEPAAVVVNHLANKHIAYVEKKRNLVAERQMEMDDLPAVNTPSAPEKRTVNKADAIISQIDADVDDPVAAAGAAAPTMDDPELIPVVNKTEKQIAQGISGQMPPLVREEPVAQATPTEVQIESVKKQKVTAKDAEDSAARVAMEIANAQEGEAQSYCFPPIDLLKSAAASTMEGTAEMRENSRRLNETLASFKIEAHIINVTRGPSVTRYEVELEKGVRLNKLTTAADDIALSLGATGVRIAAVPGKISVVGIEVPNRAVTTVSLREVIDSPEFNKAKSKSSFAVGKDIGGNCIVGNISRLPHMLIAGTTGSGKSVCMNSIIISLLYKASPEDVKLIMVDPKMVELGIYNGIPHLLIPVVTDPKKAAGSLQWAVAEMMRRYKAMSDAGVRDLESYNSIVESQQTEGKKLPQVVVIIDELADLMLVAAKEVEESICRIAQMGRAAGIHLIIATQRPSADVITGLMKANIPSRIAFAVASAMESRIILDTQGAEKLVGKGDMLYAPIGNGKPKRVQGCFVSDPEVEAVATYVKDNFNSNYDQAIMEEIEKKAAQTGNKAPTADTEATRDEMAGDEMLPAAVDVILETGQASVSMLQRRLKLGYARAARIVDEMEEKGIVGPFMGSKPRAILVTKEQWESMRSGQTAQLGFDDLQAEYILDEVPEEFE